LITALSGARLRFKLCFRFPESIFTPSGKIQHVRQPRRQRRQLHIDIRRHLPVRTGLFVFGQLLQRLNRRIHREGNRIVIESNQNRRRSGDSPVLIRLLVVPNVVRGISTSNFLVSNESPFSAGPPTARLSTVKFPSTATSSTPAIFTVSLLLPFPASLLIELGSRNGQRRRQRNIHDLHCFFRLHFIQLFRIEPQLIKQLHRSARHKFSGRALGRAQSNIHIIGKRRVMFGTFTLARTRIDETVCHFPL